MLADGTAVATARRSLEVADGAHVLLGLRHHDPEQVEKVVRGNAQLALSHVGLHDAQETSRLAADKLGQVSAPKVAGHEKLKVRSQGTRTEGELSTVDLLINIACFIKKKIYILSAQQLDLN